MAVAVLAAVGLSGCWLQPGYGPEHRNHNPLEQGLSAANVGNLDEAWATPSASGGQPLVAGNTVFTGWSAISGGLTVEAIDRRTGAPRWQRQLDGSSGAGAVASVDGGEVLTVRVSSVGPSTFEVLDPATGATTASLSVNEAADATGVTVGEGVIAYRALTFAGGGFRLVVRDRATLAVRFTAPSSLFSFGDGDLPVIVGGRMLVREDDPDTGDPEIRTYDVAGCGAPTCGPVTTVPVPPPPESTGYRAYDARMLAVADDGHLLLQRTWLDGRLQPGGIDLVSMAPDGTQDWSEPIGSVTGQYGQAAVATAGDSVFVVGTGAAQSSHGDGRLLARTGGEVWQSDEPVAAVAPVVANGLVFVGGDVFDAEGCGAATCAPLVSLDVGTADGIDGASVTNGTLFVNEAGPDGRLVALRA